MKAFRSQSKHLHTDGRIYLVIVSFTVSQSFFLIVAVPQEWLLTFGTNKMLQKK